MGLKLKHLALLLLCALALFALSRPPVAHDAAHVAASVGGVRGPAHHRGAVPATHTAAAAAAASAASAAVLPDRPWHRYTMPGVVRAGGGAAGAALVPTSAPIAIARAGSFSSLLDPALAQLPEDGIAAQVAAGKLPKADNGGVRMKFPALAALPPALAAAQPSYELEGQTPLFVLSPNVRDDHMTTSWAFSAGLRVGARTKQLEAFGARYFAPPNAQDGGAAAGGVRLGRGSHSGPEDSRLVQFEGRLWLLSVMLTKGGVRRQHLHAWSWDQRAPGGPAPAGIAPAALRSVELRCPSCTPALQEIEKNWGALPARGGAPGLLHFVYTFDPLRVLACDAASGECSKVYDQAPARGNFAEFGDYLRGGTQFVEWRHPYYLGACHSTIHINERTGVIGEGADGDRKEGQDGEDHEGAATRHRVFWVLLRAEPATQEFEIVYTGGVLPVPMDAVQPEFPREYEDSVWNGPWDGARTRAAERDVDHDACGLAFVPGSDQDQALLSVDLRFQRAVVLQVAGLRALVDGAIAAAEAGRVAGSGAAAAATERVGQVQAFVRQQLETWWFKGSHMKEL